jgi:iron-sulfur cluster repair protein YtfE (RIC family)
MTDIIQLDPALTINQIVAKYPQTTAVFNRFGFDTCCGGGVTVAQAAQRDGVEPEAVFSALHAVLSAAGVRA